MKLVNEAVDAVRKGEVLTQPDLKKTRWLWLKNDCNLKAKQKEKLQELLKDQNLKTAQAIMNHWDGVLRWFERQITNGILSKRLIWASRDSIWRSVSSRTKR